MLILRAAVLGFLVCFHLIGAAVLFRRLCPKESPWICFLVPTLALVTTLNFFQHFIPLPVLGWLLPFTLGGLLWSMARADAPWDGLRFPSIMFVAIFAFVYLLKCLSPTIANYTEGVFNLSRILNYELSSTLPPKDCWLPPYDYGGYYTFQHFGADVLRRLFSVDLGTAYNVSFSFLLSWLVLIGAGIAHALTGKRWIAIATTLVLLAGSTGSVIFLIFFGNHGADYEVATAINDVWNDHDRNPFWWFSTRDSYHPEIKLLPPTYTLYYSEFHANLGGAFLVFASLLASVEVFKTTRSNWPWILLLALPMLVVITSAWFFFVVSFLCLGPLIISAFAHRRPSHLKYSLIGALVSLVLIWPAFYSLTGNPVSQSFSWTTKEDHTPLWIFILQWWPVWIPWIALFFVWGRLPLVARWLQIALPVLLVGIEFSTFGNHGLTIEKMWGAVYGAALVTFIPLILVQEALVLRAIGFAFVAIFIVCLGSWMKIRFGELDRNNFFRLQGDALIQQDHQTKRILQVLQSLHGVTVLPGKSYWDYNSAPMVVTFSENFCYVAYFFQEEQSGRGDEAHYRDNLNNQFYSGTMIDPLPFLRSSDIGAILVWPEDKLSDSFLQKMEISIGSDYYYINCKMDEPANAGVFIRFPTASTSSAPQAPLNLDATPTP